jgi:hypothetical protein
VLTSPPVTPDRTAALVIALVAGPRSSLTFPATRPYLEFSAAGVRTWTSPTTARVFPPTTACARTQTLSLSLASQVLLLRRASLQTVSPATSSQTLTCHAADPQ